MPSELSVYAVHRGGMRATASVRNLALDMDQPQKPGERCAGFRPLEALLASLAGCSVSTLALLLQRVDQRVHGIEVVARGRLRAGHPAVLTEISLEFLVRGQGIDPGAVERSLVSAEEHMSPVWTMLKDGPRVTSSFRIVEVEQA